MNNSGKIKEASWWILIGDEAAGKLLALKKIMLKKTLRKDLQIQLPQSFEKSKTLTVYLISDSYLGLDQVFTLNLRSKEAANDEKFHANSDEDNTDKPIRQRLSDDESTKKPKKTHGNVK